MMRLPGNWQSDRLKDVCLVNASSLAANTDADYEFDYLEISNVNYHGVINPEAIERVRFEDAPSRARRRVAPKSTLISSVRPNLQAIAYISGCNGDLVCSTGFNVVEPHAKRLLPRFCYYSLISDGGRQYFESTAKGVGYPAVDDKDFGSFIVPLPDPNEQRRIAAFLDASCASIDAAVAVKRQQIAKLNTLLQSVASDLVCRGLDPKTPLKNSNIESIGNVPSHWDVKQLRYACNVNYGITLQLEKGQSAGDGVRILTVRNVTIDGALDLSEEYYIAPEDVNQDDYLRPGDLLFNWRNGSQYHVGKTAFFNLDGEFTHVSFLLRLRCGHKMYPFYLRAFLGVLKDAGFFSGSKDKVNKTFNSTELNRLQIVIPPLDEQKQICSELERRAKEVTAVRALIDAQVDKLIEYRKSLIHECVTGQRRISDEDLKRVGAHG